MTWTRTPAEFPDECYDVGLSDAGYRVHHEALTYLSRVERMDCHIRAEIVRKFAGSPHYQAAVDELVSIGWWLIDRQGYRIVKHSDVTRSSIVAQQRKRERDKKAQAAHRARAAGKSVNDNGDDVSADADYLPDYLPSSEGEHGSNGWPLAAVIPGGSS